MAHESTREREHWRGPVWVIGAVALVLFLWGLSPARRSPAETATGAVELRVWSGWTGHEKDAFEGIVAAFNAEHPGVHLTNTTTAGDDTKVFRAITGGTPPDLFFIWNYEYIGALAQNGAVRCLDDSMRSAGLSDGMFVPAALSQCRYEGRTYAMPYLSDVYALFLNRALLAEAGLDPDRPPRTLEELADTAERLTRYDESGDLVQMGIVPPDLFHLCFLMGGELYDEATHRVTADAPENVRALEYRCELLRRQGGVDKVDAFSAGFGEYASSSQEFFAGKVAMVESGQWWPSFIEKFAKDLDYAVCPLPYPADRPDLAGTTILGGNFACIPRESPHPDLAFEFLRWTQTQAAQAQFASAMHGVPNLRGMLEIPELTGGSRENEAFGVMCRIAGGPLATPFPTTPVNVLYVRELELAGDLAARETKTAEEALRGVATRVQRELDECLQWREAAP